jgi:3-hydroxybutyryl-CoA dehydratase
MDDVRTYDDEIVGYYIEDLTVGMSASFQKTVTEADIVLFAGVSGDTNPVHINEEYAKTTFFKGRIAHGMLSAAFISTVLGTRLPGPGTVYVKQNLRFRGPVRAGDTVTARVVVAEIVLEKRRALMNTVVTVGDDIVVDGDATVMLPTRGG